MDRADDGPEVLLCRFFGNFPNGAQCGCGPTPIESFARIFPNLKAPHFAFKKDLAGDNVRND